MQIIGVGLCTRKAKMSPDSKAEVSLLLVLRSLKEELHGLGVNECGIIAFREHVFLL